MWQRSPPLRSPRQCWAAADSAWTESSAGTSVCAALGALCSAAGLGLLGAGGQLAVFWRKPSE